MRFQILKLGGSVVTDKDKYFTPNLDNIKRLSIEIKESGAERLIIIHGGGSYGHPIAKKHDISNGYKKPSQLVGFSETHQAMVELNHVIVSNLLQAGVPAFAVSPSSMLKTSGKRLEELHLTVITSLLDIGIVPVLYGDAVLDTEQGFAILSGDQLIAKLALMLGAERVIFGSDVDGVFTTNPKLDPKAKLLKKVSVGNVDADVGAATSTDVTGGMQGKLSEAAPIVESGAEVIFLNAFKPGRVRDALRGEKVMGTILTI